MRGPTLSTSCTALQSVIELSQLVTSCLSRPTWWSRRSATRRLIRGRSSTSRRISGVLLGVHQHSSREQAVHYDVSLGRVACGRARLSLRKV